MVSMQSVKWVSFGISNALTRTIVHFFPSEGGITAPFPATCALRIFGQGLIEKKVVIEGARLSHPDGVRVENGRVTMPELPGIGFEGKSDLITVMRDLAS